MAYRNGRLMKVTGAAVVSIVCGALLLWPRGSDAQNPTPEERAVSLLALAELTQAWGRQDLPGRHDPHRRALGTFCHAMLNSAAFLAVD